MQMRCLRERGEQRERQQGDAGREQREVASGAARAPWRCGKGGFSLPTSHSCLSSVPLARTLPRPRLDGVPRLRRRPYLSPAFGTRPLPQIPKRRSSGRGYENRCGPDCQETTSSTTACKGRKWLYNGQLGEGTGKSIVVL